MKKETVFVYRLFFCFLWLLRFSLPHAWFGCVISVTVVDHDGYDECEVFIEGVFVSFRVWAFGGGDDACWVVSVGEPLCFAVDAFC